MNTLIIDDSVGGILLLNKIKNIKDNPIVVIDNKNYPYFLRKKKRKILNKFKSEILESDIVISSNPSISLELIKIGNKIISGQDIFFNKYSSLEDCLVITNTCYNAYLRSLSFNSISADLLINLVNDFNYNDYLINSLINEYLDKVENLGQIKNIFIMDSNLCMLKKHFENLALNVKIHYLDDFLLSEFLKEYSQRKSIFKRKRKIYVTSNRRRFYLCLEKLFNESFIDIKEKND